jgi:hypothetical protein
MSLMQPSTGLLCNTFYYNAVHSREFEKFASRSFIRVAIAGILEGFAKMFNLKEWRRTQKQADVMRPLCSSWALWLTILGWRSDVEHPYNPALT